jgi:hypothetical protein
MTQEQKAKAYDEAIRKAQDIFHTSEFIKITDLFPELAENDDEESEDERIRKWLYDLVDEGAYLCERPFATESILAYLEKQKDASKAIEAVDRIDRYIDEHVANAHDMKDSNPDKKYYRGWDDALGKMSGILQDVYSGKKQKEQEPVITHGETYRVDTLGTQQVIAGKMPQKPIECIEFDNEFEKQVSHLLASVLNGEWEYNEGFVKHVAQSLLGYAKNELKQELPLMGGDTDAYFDDLRITTKPLTSREWFDEGIKYAQRLQKEQKHNYCLYGGYPNVGRCRWCSAACSARLADVHTDEEKEYIRTIKSIISDFIRDKKPENLAYYQRIYDWLDGGMYHFRAVTKMVSPQSGAGK